ncbi:MAG TPA: glycosyltransferase family 39 protein [Thermoanaerobaculia bacterium]|nr:glycosyltransferase family 39 protein [Thermoanaerobaculia bacterium]
MKGVPWQADPGGEDRPRTIPWAILGSLALVAVAIRLYRLNHFSYWLDEILESFTIHDSWKGLWRSLRSQGIQAPIDYVVGKILGTLHPSDAARKLPAVVWGTATVVTAAAFMARRAGRIAGVVTGVLLAVSPFHVHYSQELRPYSLGMFLLCASLLALESFLARPSVTRLAALYGASLATAYALYVAALALLLAGAALVIEDAFSSDRVRSRSARRFLAAGPVFAIALWLGFLPWWPVFLTGIRGAPMGTAPVFSMARIPRFFSFFGFGHVDWQPLGWPGALFAGGCAAGAVLACRRPGVRFLLPWSIGGFAILEILERHHPIFDSIFHYTPMGIALVGLFALSLSALIARPSTKRLGIGLLILSAALEIVSLREYFRTGRPDWRPLGAYLRASPADERIITDTDYTFVCVTYYVAGADWFETLHSPGARSIVTVRDDPASIAWLREPGKTAWLVLRGGRTSALTRWAEPYPGIAFPGAEEGAVVKRIAPDR